MNQNIKMEKIEMKLNGYLVLENTAKPLGNGAYVSVPRNWINKKVVTILVEPLDNEGEVIDLRPMLKGKKIKKEE